MNAKMNTKTVVLVSACLIFVILFFQMDVVSIAFSAGSNLNSDARCQSEGDVTYHAIIMDSLASTRLNAFGGTGQWYHYTESLLPLFHESTSRARYLAHARTISSDTDSKVQTPLLIAFRDKKSVDALGAFGRMMTVLLLSGGYYDQIIFGYAKPSFIEPQPRPEPIPTNGGIDSFIDPGDLYAYVEPLVENYAILDLDASHSGGFVRVFGVDLKQQSSDDLFVNDAAHVVVNVPTYNMRHDGSSTGSASSSTSAKTVSGSSAGSSSKICTRIVTHVDWLESFGKYHWLTSPDNITQLHTTVDRVCNHNQYIQQHLGNSKLPIQSSSVYQQEDLGPEMQTDDIDLGFRGWQRRAARHLPTIKTYAHPRLNTTTTTGATDTASRPPYKVLVYQRNKYRKLWHKDWIINELDRQLNDNGDGTIDALREGPLWLKLQSESESESESQSQSQSQSQSKMSSHRMWDVESMTHDGQRPPCLLLDTIGKTDVLVTSHGFQATLLLFQPVRSVLVEVFPYWYPKPYVFGSIQVSLRLAGLHYRSYLCEESTMKSYILAFIEKFVTVFTRRNCLREYTNTCGAMTKYQAVRMSPEFIARVTRFLRIQFNT